MKQILQTHLGKALLILLMVVLGGSNAWGEEQSLEVTTSNFSEITTSYTTKFTHTFTLDETNSVTLEAYGVYKNSGIQINKGKGTYIKNTTAFPGYITKIIINWTASGKNSPKLYFAKDGVASTGSTLHSTGDNTKVTQTYTITDASTKGYNYFYFDGTTVTGACVITKMTIFYEIPSTSAVATPTFSVAEGTYTTTQNVTITTATEGATIYYTTDGATPTTNSSVYSSAIPVSSTTTIKAIAVKAGMDNSSVATATYTIVSLDHAGTQADPYTVADAHTAIDANAGVTGVYVSGIVCQASASLYSSKYLSYYISDDGTTTNKLEAYNGLGIGGANFTSVDDIKVGDKVVIYGNLTKYSSTYEFAADNQLVSIVRPASITVASTTIDVPAAGENDVIDVTYENITSVDAEVQFFEADGETSANYTWITASINSDNDIEYNVDANTGEARTAYMKVYALDDEANDVYSGLITVTQAAYVAPPAPVSGKYVKVTSTNDLTDGQYLIVYENGNVAFNGGLETLDGVGNTIAVTISNNEIAATSTTTAAEFTIDVTAGTIKSASGEYIFASTYNNELRTSTSVPEKANTFSFNSGDAVISVAVTETQSVTLRYNSASNQTRFRYYKSGQQAIQLYKKVESVTVTNAGYATYCSENALDFTGSSIKAYVGTREGYALTFSEVTKVPARTGLLLVCKGGATENIPVVESAPAVASNCLTGVTKATTLTENDYILNVVNGGAGFYKAGTFKSLAANRAYIPAAVGGNIKSFGINLTTGIDLPATEKAEKVIFDLSGRRVEKPAKGLYIVNGKKVLF